MRFRRPIRLRRGVKVNARVLRLLSEETRAQVVVSRRTRSTVPRAERLAREAALVEWDRVRAMHMLPDLWATCQTPSPAERTAAVGKNGGYARRRRSSSAQGPSIQISGLCTGVTMPETIAHTDAEVNRLSDWVPMAFGIGLEIGSRVIDPGCSMRSFISLNGVG